MNAVGFCRHLFRRALFANTCRINALAPSPLRVKGRIDDSVPTHHRRLVYVLTGIGLLLTSQQAFAQDSERFGGSPDIVKGYVNGEAAKRGILIGNYDHMYFSQANADLICRWRGYTRAIDLSCVHPDGRCGYTSPGDNVLWQWTGTSFVAQPARNDNRWLSAMTCVERLPQCQDGADNDGDGLIDRNDPDCSSDEDNDESSPLTQCSDGIDNDGDGLVDFGTTQCPASNRNLILNGSFEAPSVIGGTLLASAPGWSSTSPGQLFEIQRGVFPSQDGSQHLELDNHPHGVHQTLPAYPKATFKISFYYSPRPGYGLDQKIAVNWNGATIAQVSHGNDNLGWRYYEFTVQGNSRERPNYLELLSVSNRKSVNDSGGNLVDNVQVSVVEGSCKNPDPGCDSFADDNEDTQCRDGADNDDDGVVDREDPGCWININDPKTYDSARDNESAATTQCQDKIDNDSDAVIDAQDPGCWTNISDPKSYDRTRNDENAATTQCQDLIDNDGDGLIDIGVLQIPEAPRILPDPGCSDRTDNDESDGTSQCQDKVDNDKDGVIDAQDPGCWKDTTDPKTYDKTLNNESLATSQCQDKKDNDGDGLIDLADPGCSGPTDNNEADGTSQCQDKVDNDNDGLVDLADPGCSGPTDNDESDGTSQCQDKKDNDGDGLIDLADPGCSDPTDNNEADGTSQCQDKKDNDGDGLIDLADPGCSGPTDNNEADGTSQCQDKVDNDNDGLVDLADPGCSGPTDNDESDKTSQCQDKSDNDNDGVTDAADPGCWTNPADPNTYDKTRNDESAATTQCQDKVDNDKDGKIDRDDPGCRTNPRDPETYDKTLHDESVDKGECFDGIDNDDDGLIDALDPGCDSGDKDKEDGEPARLTVGVECVTDNVDNTKTAYLSYNNTTSEELLVSSSEDQTTLNEFVADKTTTSPPKSFKPGSAKGAVVVNFSGASLTWVVRAQGSALSQAVVNANTPKCAAVVPMAECRGYSGGIMRVRLGYNNPNTFEQMFNVGAVNGFKPGKADRGQPTRFFAGMNKSAFEVALESDNETTTWNINGAKVTISPQLPACPGQCADTPTGAVTGELDKVAADMSELMKQAAELLASAKANKTEAQRKRDRRDAERSKRKAAEYEALAKSLTIQFPAVVKTCPQAPPFCQAVDRGPTLDALRSVYANLRNSIVRTVSRAFWRSESRTKRNTKLVKEARALEQQGIAGIESLPRFPVECK